MQKNIYEETPLLLAFKNGHFEVEKLLIKMGAEDNLKVMIEKTRMRKYLYMN